MNFVLAATDRYWWPVTVRMPDPITAGKIVEQTFKMQFEPQDRIEQQKQQAIFESLETEVERMAHEYEQFPKFCKGWDDVIGESGTAVPFNEENLNAAIKKSWFRAAVYRAYNKSLAGEEARLGN